MRIHAGSFLHGLLPRSRAQAALLAGIAALSFAVVACSGDDEDDPAASGATGGVATATATSPSTNTAEASPTTASTPAGGTLIPLDTATPTPASSAPTPPGSTPPAVSGEAAMIDLEPCGAGTHFEEQMLSGTVPALAYKDVPQGKPILFPFEEGRLLELDSRAGATTVFYEVPNVGILTVQVAGANAMDRNAVNPVQGSIIGHFGGAFGEMENSALPGYQLVAVVGTEGLVQSGNDVYTGEALDPTVTDCLVLQ